VLKQEKKHCRHSATQFKEINNTAISADLIVSVSRETSVLSAEKDSIRKNGGLALVI